MNWKELYALVNENIKNAVSGLYKPAGDVTFAELTELSQSVLGYTYTVTDAFTTDNRFTDYDTETQTGHSFPADTEVAVIVTGTTENPVYMFNVMGGIMDGYATKGDLDNYVEKEAGKGLSTNDYTDADKALVADSPITVTATASPISTANGKPRAITIYGKSEIVDGAIKSAGEGWTTVDLGTLNYTADPSIGQYGRFYTASLANVIQNNSSILCPIFYQTNSLENVTNHENGYMFVSALGNISFSRNGYETDTDFKSAMSGVLLCYQLADPTQGNTIAVKTDNGSGIDGTMAVFSTGTPLYGVSDTVRDVAEWDGSAGTVTKNCKKADLNNVTWELINRDGIFVTTSITDCYVTQTRDERLENCITSKYPVSQTSEISSNMTDKSCLTANGRIYVRDTSFNNNVTDFVNSLTDVTCVYRIATPTTEQLTQTENESIAGLKTYAPQTTITINSNSDYSVEAYANTANGQAIADLKKYLLEIVQQN